MNPMAGNVDGIERQVFIYGPKGYYRYVYAPWPGEYQKQTFTFYNAPNGAYRFRVYSPFYRYDTNNKYPKVNFNIWNWWTFKYPMQR